MTTSYIERAIKFIRIFAPFIEDCEYLSDFERAVNKFNLLYKRKVSLASGCSRRVFITSDYAVKIDIYSEDSEFGCCESEYNFYCLCPEKFKHCFTKVTKVIIGNRSFYIVPRANHVGRKENLSKFCEEDLYFIRRHISDLHNFNVGILSGSPVIIDFACNDME